MTDSTENAATQSAGQAKSFKLPAALTPLMALNHWVVWRLERNAQGEPTKVPYQARAARKFASNTNPRTWASYAEACSAAAQDDSINGIGFVLKDTEIAAF